MTDYDPKYKSGAPRLADLVDEAPQDTLPECNKNDCDALLVFHLITEDKTVYRRERCEAGHLNPQERIGPIGGRTIRGP